VTSHMAQTRFRLGERQRGACGRPSTARRARPRLSAVEFRVLGPLEVADGRHPVALGGPKQRSDLALLLLNANQVVSTDRLTEEIWGDGAREGAGRTLEVSVSNLPKLLDDPALVVSQ